jgi:hypothetical protein
MSNRSQNIKKTGAPAVDQKGNAFRASQSADLKRQQDTMARSTLSRLRNRKSALK